MIQHLELSNFKRFSHLRLAFAPLTLLTGSNSSGKSTVIQSLLLVQQAATVSSGTDGVSLVGPNDIDLGEALDILNWDAADQRVVIKVMFARGRTATWTFAVPTEREQHLEIQKYTGPDRASLGFGASEFKYLCAERLGPRDIATVATTLPSEIGMGARGEYTAQILAMMDRLDVDPPLRHPDSANSAIPSTLRSQAEAWLSTVVCETQLRSEWISGGGAVMLRFKPPGVRGNWTRPANAGFGLSYAIPVIVSALASAAGSILLVENPEAHLHPRAQTEMGQFLARIAAAGRQVIVETHSDHIVSGIQLAILKTNDLRARDVLVHFMSPTGRPETANTEQIGLTDLADLTKKSRGFMDQSRRDQAYLARLRHQRRMAIDS